MALELELKLSRVADEFTDFQFAKDRSGPLFLSRETDTMFILEIHLRGSGYQKRNIKIEINEDGTRIVISGEKEIQETVIVGWRLVKKEKEIRGFKKAFKIPDGVILDKIRAKFDEDESILTISMPKKEKGICGFSVDEVNEDVVARGGSETLQIDDHKKTTNQQSDQETEDEFTKENEAAVEKKPQEKVFPEETQKKSIHDVQKQTEIEEQKGDDERLQKVEEDIERNKNLQHEAAQGFDESKVGLEKDDINQGVGGNMQAEQTTDEDHREENDIKARREAKDATEEKGRFKICTPIVVGSSLLLSIVVFVIQFIRTKSQQANKAKSQ